MRIIDGWISLHRKTLDNPIVCKDSDHLAVWVYLLLNATHTKYDVLFKGKRITLQPGQLITGRKSISEKINVDEYKVQRILKTFETAQQIAQQTTAQNRLVSILNWDSYQQSAQQNAQQVHNDCTTSAQRLHTNNNVNKGNNVNNVNNSEGPHDPKVKKHKHGEFKQVLLSDSEVESLKEKLGEQVMHEYIRRLDEYIGSKGASYKSHYLTILKWHRDDENKAKPQKDTKKDFNEREYDYDDLERKLLGRGQ